VSASAIEGVGLLKVDEERAKSLRRRVRRQRLLVHSLQVLFLCATLAAWQWVPSIHALRKVSPAFDPFFISSPERLGKTLYYLAVGGVRGVPLIWKPFENSVVPAVIGTAIAVVVGALAGLICSNWVTLNRVVRPFVIVGNALPRITMIPIIVIIAGPTKTANILIGFLVVFFLVFWNAYEGGVSVSQETLENVRILGASRFQQLRRVRLPYVLVWTFASLPNAVGFGLTAIITSELFTGGSNGLGQVLLLAVQTANADLTFSVTIIIGITGLLLIGSASLLRKRVLHWWY
jgi:NitT/TauT family transport system permease protein